MTDNYRNEVRIFEAFVETLARRIGGRDTTITAVRDISLAFEGRTDILLQGAHGEIWVSIHRGGFQADPADFLLLVRIFDSVFPAFRVSSPSADKMPFEHQHNFELVDPDLGKIQLSGAFQGQFSITEIHFMQWFILSEQYLTLPIVAKLDETGDYRTFLDAQYLGARYQLQWVSEIDGQQLYRVTKDSEPNLSSKTGQIVMGSVTLSLTGLSAMLSGASLSLDIPEYVTGISAEEVPESRTLRRMAGVYGI